MSAPVHPTPPFEAQTQHFPGHDTKLNPKADHGEQTYKGAGKLLGKFVLITGGDSGIGRAVAIAFAREGADIAISYLDEEDDATEARDWIEKAGRKCVLLPGDIASAKHCEALVERTVAEFGGLDVLVNNAAYQKPNGSLDDITTEDWDRHFQVNINAMFYVTKFAAKHLKRGASIINTSSVNSKHPMPSLLAYSATKAAIANFTVGAAQLLAERQIRVNAVLPGPIWTPFIPAGMHADQIKSFGSNTPFGRPGQPAELAPAYVSLASNESSYTSGALVVVAGGMPII